MTFKPNDDNMQQSASHNKDLLMMSLSKFYEEKEKSNIKQIIPIIHGKSQISLRLLDWFVTNYSKKTSTNIINQKVEANAPHHFNVYLSYRSQLKAYSKHQFDPFRRRDRIQFFYDRENSIETTIGQLNFFRWVIQNNILTYIQENMQAIEQDMFSVQKKSNAIIEENKSTIGNNNISNNSNNNSNGVVENHVKGETSASASATATEKGKKRIELSKSFVKNMNRFEGTQLISFN